MTALGYNLGDAFGSVIISTNVGQAMSEAQRQFDSGLASMSASIRSWGDSLTQMGAQMSILSEPLRGVISTGLDVVADFDDIMSSIEARTGSSAEEMEKIRAFARQQGADSVFSAQQVGEALLGLMTSGMSVEKAMATLPSVLQAATADASDLGATADIVTNIMASFGLEAENSQEIVDALARASGASKASITSLGQGFGNVGGMAKQFGLDVNETAAILAIFSNNGIQGAEAGTQLRSMLNHMMSDAKPVQEAWKTLGVSLYDAQGNMRDLNTVMQELDGALDKLPVEEKNRLMGDLAGTYGILGFTALRSSMSIEEMQRVMEGQADASSIAEKMMGTLRNMVNSLMGSWETLLEVALSPTVEEYIKPIINAGIELLNTMTLWAQQNPETTQTIVILGMAIAGLGPVLIGAGLAISVAGAAFGLLLSPITLVSGALFSLAVIFRNQLAAISRFVRFFVDDLQRMDVFNAIRSALGWGQNNESYLEPLLMSFGMTREAAEQTVNSIHASFLQLYGVYLDFQRTLTNVMTIGTRMFDVLSTTWGGTGDVFQTLRTVINNFTDDVLGLFGITGDAALQVQSWLVGVVNGLEGIFDTAADVLATMERNLLTFGRYIRETVDAFIFLRDQGFDVFDTLRTMIQFNLRGFLELIGITGAAADSVQVLFTNAVDAMEGFVIGAQAAFNDLMETVSNFEFGDFLGGVGDSFSGLTRGVNILINTFNLLRASGMNVFDAIRTEINLFGQTVLSGLGITGGASDAILDWVQQAVTNVERLFNAISGVFGSVWDWLSTISISTEQVGQIIGPLYEVGSWLLALTNPLSLAWKILQTLGVDFVGIIEDVANGISRFFDTLAGGGTLADAFSAVFGPDVVAGVLTGVQIVQDAINGLIGLVSDIWEFVSPALTQFGNWFTTDVMPAISDLVNNSLMPALQSIGDYLSQLWEIVSPYLEQFATWFLYDALPQIEQFISGVIIPAIGDFIDVLTRIWNDVSPFLLEFANWFLTAALPTILDFINGVVIPIIGDFINLLKSIWEAVSPTLETLYNWFISDGLPFIMEALEGGRQAVQTVIDALSSIWDDSQSGLQLLQDGLNTAFTWLNDNIFTPLGDLIGGIVAGFSLLWPDSQKGIDDFKNGLDAAVKWVDTNIIQPIVNGISKIINAFGGLWSGVQGAVNDFKNGVQGVLDGITKAINDVLAALGLAQHQKEQMVVTTSTNADGDVIESHSPADGNGKGFSVNKTKMENTIGRVMASVTPSAPIVIGGGGRGGFLGSFATGADYLNQDGFAYVHEGEGILTKEQNADRLNGGPKIEINIGQIVASGAAEGRAAGDALAKTLEEKIRFSGGSLSG